MWGADGGFGWVDLLRWSKSGSLTGCPGDEFINLLPPSASTACLLEAIILFARIAFHFLFVVFSHNDNS